MPRLKHPRNHAVRDGGSHAFPELPARAAGRLPQNTKHKMAQNVAESTGTLDMNRASHPGTETG
jgi:hypothetical protein